MKPRTPFAIYGTDQLFVEVKAVMSPFLALVCGIPQVRFGKEKKLYFRMDDAIDWLKKEVKTASPSERWGEILAALQKAKTNALAGNMVENR